jgi:hypothetical protein
LLAGIAAEVFGLAIAMLIVAALTLISGVIVAIRMAETLPHRSATSPAFEQREGLESNPVDVGPVFEALND